MVADGAGQPLGVVSGIVGRVAGQVGPEYPGRRCRQEVFVDDGRVSVAATVVGQTFGGHLLVGRREVATPDSGGITGGHRGVVTLAPARGQRDTARLDLAEAPPQASRPQATVPAAKQARLVERAK